MDRETPSGTGNIWQQLSVSFPLQCEGKSFASFLDRCLFFFCCLFVFERGTGGQQGEPIDVTSSNRARGTHLERNSSITSLRQEALTSFVPIMSTSCSTVNPAPSICCAGVAVTALILPAFLCWGNPSVLSLCSALFLQVLFSRGIKKKKKDRQEKNSKGQVSICLN